MTAQRELRAEEPQSEPRGRFGLRLSTIAFIDRWAFKVILAALGVAAALYYPQLFVNGLVVGSVIALGALGLTLTYSVLRFPNMAQGLMLVLGGYLTFFFYSGNVRRSAQTSGDVTVPLNVGMLPGASDSLFGLSFGYGMVLASGLAILLMIGITLLLDRFVYRPVRVRRRATVLMLTILSFGVAFLLVGLIAMTWGTLPRAMTPGLHYAVDFPFGIRLKPDLLFVFAVALTATAVLYVLLNRTKLGKAMRAVMDNVDLARLSGISIEHVVFMTWVVVGFLSGLSGTLLGIQGGLNPNLGFTLVLPLFAAVAVGGIGNPVGAMLGGLIIGVAQEMSVAFFDPGYKVGASFFILVVVLLARPTGIFGANDR